MLAPSTKKGRRSWKNVSNADRLTSDGSASTWPKSGLTVKASVRLLLSPSLRSPPMLPLLALPVSNGLPVTLGVIACVAAT